VSRPPRIEFAGAVHVIARGDRREEIFRNDRDRWKFLGYLAEGAERYRVKPLSASQSGARGGVALDIRLSFTNRKLARRSLRKLLSWDFDKLIIAHGVCIEKDAKPFVERAFRWLAR
jgi:hypothetical protein